MRVDRMRIAVGALCAAILLFGNNATFAQGSESKGGSQRPATAESDGQKKVDEFAEAAAKLSGPAANPECMWLGRRAVGLLVRDDLDTAFRHLDLYDRFGCPSGHVQATFRCVLLLGDDPKGEKLSARTHACWINPTADSAASSSAAAPSGTSNR